MNISLFGSKIIFAVCSLTVNVPVLSLAITVQLPKLSTEFSFLTITFLLLILFEPIVNEDGVLVTAEDIVTVKGSVSDKSEGYSLYLNGEKKMIVELNGSNEESNYREFEYQVPVADGDIITLKAVDLVGHETVKQIKVTIDKTIPTINVEGVENNKIYNESVTPKVSVNPEDATLTATLNGKDYNFDEISEEGDYELVITAVGTNGVENTLVINFTIDKTAPIITVNGIEDGKIYNTDVMPNVTVEEGATLSITLNDEEYNEAAIVDEGKYELIIKAVDEAGNITEVVYNFEIDKTAPEITVDGVIDGMKYDKEVKPVITVNEDTELTMTLNGEAYNGEEIESEGEYILKVVAKDKAGNITELELEFSIKFPSSSTKNPTPTPKPGEESGSGVGTGTVNDDKGNENQGNGNNNVITTIPKTGGTNSIYVIGAALILVAGGAIIGFRRKTN